MREHEHESGRNLTTADIASAPSRSPDNAVDTERVQGVDDSREHMALLPPDELDRLKAQWSDIQSDFVDEPRRSVQEADGLVADTIKQLAESFADARASLENQWSRGADVSTEDLRVALRRYRSFFERLLTV
jgi:hypothetical protein